MINLRTRILAAAAACTAIFLSGCAATVTRSDGTDGKSASAAAGPAIAVPAESLKKVVIVFEAAGTFAKDAGWNEFTKEWGDIFVERFKAKGIEAQPRANATPARGEIGTVLTLKIKDFRNLRPGAKIALGMLSGNAFINSTGDFSDLATGKVYGTQNYNSTGSALQGIFAPTSPQQMYAIADQVINDLNIK
jgi:hypothetical protein